MTDLSEFVLVQKKTAILLRSIVELIRIILISSVLVVACIGTFYYFTFVYVATCNATDAAGFATACVPSSWPQNVSAYSVYGLLLVIVSAVGLSISVVNSSLRSTQGLGA